MVKYRGQVHLLWDQHLKKQMKVLRIRLLTDLYRDTDFYPGEGGVDGVGIFEESRVEGDTFKLR